MDNADEDEQFAAYAPALLRPRMIRPRRAVETFREGDERSGTPRARRVGCIRPRSPTSASFRSNVVGRPSSRTSRQVLLQPHRDRNGKRGPSAGRTVHPRQSQCSHARDHDRRLTRISAPRLCALESVTTRAHAADSHPSLRAEGPGWSGPRSGLLALRSRRERSVSGVGRRRRDPVRAGRRRREADRDGPAGFAERSAGFAGCAGSLLPGS